MKPGVATHLAVAQSPQRRLSSLYFDAAPSPACAVAEHHSHLVLHGAELLRLHLPGLPAFEDFLKCPGERSTTAAGPRFHGTSGIDVLDLRIHEFHRSR